MYDFYLISPFERKWNKIEKKNWLNANFLYDFYLISPFEKKGNKIEKNWSYDNLINTE